jgi:hypothetical protein
MGFYHDHILTLPIASHKEPQSSSIQINPTPSQMLEVKRAYGLTLHFFWVTNVLHICPLILQIYTIWARVAWQISNPKVYNKGCVMLCPYHLHLKVY